MLMWFRWSMIEKSFHSSAVAFVAFGIVGDFLGEKKVITRKNNRKHMLRKAD